VFFAAIIVVALVVLLSMAHTHGNTEELFRPESYKVVAAVFGTELVFLIMSVVIHALLSRELVEEEGPDAE
jgi:uncharacterized membrane protein